MMDTQQESSWTDLLWIYVRRVIIALSILSFIGILFVFIYPFFDPWWQLKDEEVVSTPYELAAVDTMFEMTLYYKNGNDLSVKVGSNSETVFEAGANDKYIVAAIHPFHQTDRPDTDYLDKKITRYYYLIRALDGPDKLPNVSVRGPFDAKAYATEKQRLGLPPFTTVIDSLK